MSFYHYTTEDAVLRIASSGEIHSDVGSFGYGVYGLSGERGIPCRHLFQLSAAAFGGCPDTWDKFEYAIKVRLPSCDSRMSSHDTSDDGAIPPRMRRNIRPWMKQWLWDESISLSDWAHVSIIVRPNDNGSGPEHHKWRDGLSRSAWAAELGISYCDDCDETADECCCDSDCDESDGDSYNSNSFDDSDNGSDDDSDSDEDTDDGRKCTICCTRKSRGSFSFTQWSKGPGNSKCQSCTGGGGGGGVGGGGRGGGGGGRGGGGGGRGGGGSSSSMPPWCRYGASCRYGDRCHFRH